MSGRWPICETEDGATVVAGRVGRRGPVMERTLV